MIDKVGIRLAFRAKLQTVSGLPDWETRIAWENQDFTPPACNVQDPRGSRWVRETYLRGTERQTAYGFVEENSFMQYDIFTPAGGGTEEAERLAKAIGDVFKAATGLTSTGVPGVTAATPSAASANPIQISIYRSECLKGSESKIGQGIWYMVPVRITFRAYGNN